MDLRKAPRDFLRWVEDLVYPRGINCLVCGDRRRTDPATGVCPGCLKKLEAERAQSDEYVRLARLTIESFINDHNRIAIPDWVPQEMHDTKAGAFVSIHKQGQLRGCIGTISPVRNSLAMEIIENAVSAASRDPRFDPIRPDELKWLEISVDVLGEPEEIASEEQLDVKRYGVIVSKGHRRGLLLPDLEGVDTPRQQVDIARRKAGIGPKEKVNLQRFEVVRHV